MSGAFTIRLDEETLTAVDALSRRTERSRNWIVRQAIKDYVELQNWQEARIDEGLSALDNLDFASPEEVERVLRKYSKS